MYAYGFNVKTPNLDVSTGIDITYISVFTLAKKAGFYDEFSEGQKDFIDTLEPLNIEARYPSHKERLLKSLTENKCKEIITETIDLQSWIKKKL